MLGSDGRPRVTTDTGEFAPPAYAHLPTAASSVRPFTADEARSIQDQLDQLIEADQIQFRPSAQGSVAYVEGWKVLSLANEVFGFNGWSSEILHLGIDFVDCQDGRISLGISCLVRVHLRDGTFHDDIGYGSAENQRSKAVAYEKARKEAVTDAMKRALRMFGSRLGNCAYDKAFLRQVRAGPSHPRPHPVAGSGPHHLTRPPQGPTISAQHGGDTASIPPIRISNNPAPANFAPQWKHPKAVNNSSSSLLGHHQQQHRSDPPPTTRQNVSNVPPEQAVPPPGLSTIVNPEAMPELIMTEERTTDPLSLQECHDSTILLLAASCRALRVWIVPGRRGSAGSLHRLPALQRQKASTPPAARHPLQLASVLAVGPIRASGRSPVRQAVTGGF